MVRGGMTPENNLQVLQWILDEKFVLFGKFSPTLTQEDKNRAWKSIFEKCLALELPCAVGKQCTSIKTDFYQNQRRRTMVCILVRVFAKRKKV